MRSHVRALPMAQLMPAARSGESPVATSVADPERTSSRTVVGGHPICHHVAGHPIGPRTEIRLGARAHEASTVVPSLHNPRWWSP